MWNVDVPRNMMKSFEVFNPPLPKEVIYDTWCFCLTKTSVLSPLTGILNFKPVLLISMLT